MAGLSVDAYRELTGSRAKWPAGLAVVAARRAFTRDLPLPPGGVLLSIDVRYGDGWLFEGDMQFRCDTEERLDSRGRCIEGVNVYLRSGDTTDVLAKVHFALRWPEEEDD
jgi:hypothetical protein